MRRQFRSATYYMWMERKEKVGTQFNERNISMVMDMYELTMSNGYFSRNCRDTVAAFDVFCCSLNLTAIFMQCRRGLSYIPMSQL